ncbi:TetR family transcriptional regulator [Rathayibacter sp. YIM 133350]|uniref:TetR/AcrR family transcriptional regulator n=1 Tax=Rathayibacter sp. YIM 133350 TaxID=3131992 RepID=UPI00307DBF91
MPRIPAPERRAALVQAAVRVIARGGVSAATTRAIVAEAGMSLASFHYAFASHDELMAEVIAWVVEGEQVAILPDEIPEGGVREVVRAGLSRYFGLLRENPQREQAVNELALHALRTPGMQNLAARQYARYHALAADALLVAAERSGIRWALPIDDIARLLVALTDGLTLAWLVDRDDAATARLIENAADAVARMADE